MKLKIDADLSNFLPAVQECSAAVWFDSASGDRLNLKSALSGFVFLVAAADPALLRQGRIRLEQAEDLPRLLPYLEDDDAD